MLSIPAATAQEASVEMGDRTSGTELKARFHECPRCDSRSVTRSRIRGWVGHAAKRLLNVRPYRCLDCWHRFISTSSRES